MKHKAINFREKFDLVAEQWSPKIIAQMNETQFKIAKIQGEFDWHKHPETDEAFIVVSGSMRIDFRDGPVNLDEGEMFVVPKGTEHKPVAEGECQILLIEPSGTVNTGDTITNRTHLEDEWI